MENRNEALLPLFGDPVGPWIKSFAWIPHFTIDAGWTWMRPIWKRHIHKHQYLDGGSDFCWQYRRFSILPGGSLRDDR